MDKELGQSAANEPPGSRRLSVSLRGKAQPLPVDRFEAFLPASRYLSRERIEHAASGLALAAGPRLSPGSDRFRRAFFPEASRADWNDWQWQIAHRVKSADRLSGILALTEDEQRALAWYTGALPFSITPYYASLIDPTAPAHPLRRCTVPVCAERQLGPGESADPLCEEHDSPAPGLVHRYPDRALFLVTRFCSTYCRYCTRSRMVGGEAAGAPTRAHWEQGLEYIAKTPAIRDVLLSGGDPLILRDEDLDWLLSRLRRIPHVEFIRIGTKVPVVLPQRVTKSLVKVLRRYHPLWMSIHCTHPAELSPETQAACVRLADAGIPLGSQTVLLSGINNTVETLKQLFHGLLRIRVRPYYLYQCDPIQGSAHFRTTVQEGLTIMRGLRGHTTGYAVPTYVIDAPGGGGKIPLYPESVLGADAWGIRLRNYEGKTFTYPEERTGLASPEARPF